MKFLLFILLLCAGSLRARAEIIPSSRRMTWGAPGTTVGVIGGIPTRTTIYKNLVTEGADNTGMVDCHTLLQTTLQNCPAGQVVYLPAGTYLLTSRILWQFGNATLRGAGMGQTILQCDTGVAADNGVFDAGIAEYPRPQALLPISAGATVGSTNLTVASTTTIAVGKMIRIEHTNSDWVHTVTDQTTNNMSCMHLVTGKDATHIGITPPLVMDFTNSPCLAVYPNYLFSGNGWEDLTFEMANSDCASAVFLQQAYGCWSKNVEVKHAKNKQFWFYWVMNHEVRQCYTHDRRVAVGDSNAEGIDFYESCCWNLVEDNICINAGFPMIIFGDYRGGCAGNVVGYNFCDKGVTASGVAGATLGNNHGPHNMMNLFEGNVVQTFQADSYYGSSSHTTVFRNYLSGGYDKAAYQWPIALALMKWNTYYNLVGNVLGTNGYSQVYQPTNVNFSGSDAVIYKIGYPNLGNQGFSGWGTNTVNADWYDANVQDTLIRHGNYDYVNNAIVWDGSIADHALPNSYYLDGKPTWWSNCNNGTWPSIGSDKSPMVGMIPAQLRSMGIYYGPLSPGLSIAGKVTFGGKVSR